MNWINGSVKRRLLLIQVQSFCSHLAHSVALISDSVALSQAPTKADDHGHGASVLHGVPVYLSAYTKVPGGTQQGSGWDWTRDLQSQVQRQYHYTTHYYVHVLTTVKA